MNELRLDYQLNRPFPLGGLVLLAFALLALGLTGAYYLKLQSQTARWEARLEQLSGENRHKPVVVDKATAAELAQEVRQANEVLRKLTMPWGDLFRAVESTGSKDVTLLALAPDTEKRTVKIYGEAKNFESLLNYITLLENQKEFGTVYLQSHQIQQQDPEKPIRFTLQAVWREVDDGA